MQQSDQHTGTAGADLEPPVAAHPLGDDDHGEEHIHLPPPSVWPITTAGGAALGGLGLVTVLQFSIVGLIVMAIGIFMWIQELRHEPH